MLQLPMIPGWDGMHPLLTHFPLTLFFLGPIFVLMASFTKATTRRAFMISAIITLILGVVSTHIAFVAGRATAASLSWIGEVNMLLERHQEFASSTRSSFTLAVLLFGLIMLICRLLHLHVRELTVVLPLAAITFYGLGLFWLINTACTGERLVHEFGVGSVPVL